MAGLQTESRNFLECRALKLKGGVITGVARMITKERKRD